jgi:hypothetical protein
VMWLSSGRRRLKTKAIWARNSTNPRAAGELRSPGRSSTVYGEDMTLAPWPPEAWKYGGAPRLRTQQVVRGSSENSDCSAMLAADIEDGRLSVAVWDVRDVMPILSHPTRL